MKPPFTHEFLLALFDYHLEGAFVRKVALAPASRIGEIVPGNRATLGYVKIRVAGKKYLLHHLVWYWHHGSWPSRIDHIDGDPSNNRIENLRECTHTQNLWNAKARNPASGVKGVYWHEDKQRFRVRLRANGKRYSFGYFKTLEEARDAVIAAREQMHKEFARHG